MKQLDGILFFPVTPFDKAGAVNTTLLAEHVESRLPFNPGAVFAACGTGEFHALSSREVQDVTRTTIETVAGRVPVVAGTGGPLGHAIEIAKAAAADGADALLILPPYLVSGNATGTADYVEAILEASGLEAILYHRATGSLTSASLERLLRHPLVVGFKDGVGDIGLAQELVLTARASGREDLQLFNGLLTAEWTQGAYRALGIPLYSSAAFAMAPAIATAYYDAYTRGDETRRLMILDHFYRPLVKLRDEVPGFGVALIKAGLRLGSGGIEPMDVGGVRPPLTDPNAAQTARLADILAAGHELVAA
jgi:5-dehydro-4-deoxyglucarate dehydratase